MQQEPEIETATRLFLDRFSPPKHIAGSPDMIADEAFQITAAISRCAPVAGFAEWWIEASSEMIRRMKTRAWPLVSEVEAACRAVNERRRATDPSLSSDTNELAAIDRMEGWFRKFRDQIPGHGKPSRTMALIQRGVLADLREAHFRGFDLTPEQSETARNMRPGRAEEEHHRRVHGRILASIEAKASWREEIMEKHASVKPGRVDAAE